MAIVKKSLKDIKPPPPDRVEEIANISEDKLDYSDIPELGADFWMNAKPREPATKSVVSLRVDPDVIAFFKAQNPKGYTARMAAILSAYVDAQQK